MDVVSGDVVEQFLQRQREELKLRSKSGRDLLAAAREQDAKLQADGAGGAAPSTAAPAPASVAVLRRMASDTQRAMERLEAAKEAAQKRDEARYSRCRCVESQRGRRQYFSPPCAGTWTSSQATQRSGQCIVSAWDLTVLWHAPHPSTAHAAPHQLADVRSMVGCEQGLLPVDRLCVCCVWLWLWLCVYGCVCCVYCRRVVLSSWRVGSFREATRTPREQPSAIVVWMIRDAIFTVLRTPHPISIPTTHAFARVSAKPRCHTGYGGWIDSNTWSLVRTTSGRVRGVTPGYRSRSASTCSGGCGKGGVWLMSRPVDLHDTHTPGRQCML